jgi:hypothetical protein
MEFKLLLILLCINLFNPAMADNVMDPYGREGEPVECSIERTDGTSYEEVMNLPPAPEDIVALVKVNKKDKQNRYGYQVKGHNQLYWSSTKFKNITDSRPEDIKHPISDKTPYIR